MDDANQKSLTIAEATQPSSARPNARVKAWQDEKVRAAIKSADAGEFAAPEDVIKVIRKYLPHG